MRIIAGSLKGQQFQAPHGHRTHPMSDKMRGALFNILGDIEGLTFLDAYAGSGGLAFEAISRGAKEVVAIDKDGSAQKTIAANLKDLRLDRKVKLVKANVAGWSIHNMEKTFDIVLLDPPYEEINTSHLQKLINRHVKKGGLAVLSFPGHQKPPKFDRAEMAADKNYGDGQLVFYRKNN
jgi:16S rRNA (guanine966-N2)-methyltransferase